MNKGDNPMEKQKLIKSIIAMLEEITSLDKIERIHRFVQHMYIKK